MTPQELEQLERLLEKAGLHMQKVGNFTAEDISLFLRQEDGLGIIASMMSTYRTYTFAGRDLADAVQIMMPSDEPSMCEGMQRVTRNWYAQRDAVLEAYKQAIKE